MTCTPTYAIDPRDLRLADSLLDAASGVQSQQLRSEPMAVARPQGFAERHRDARMCRNIHDVPRDAFRDETVPCAVTDRFRIDLPAEDKGWEPNTEINLLAEPSDECVAVENEP